ncbi:MAG: nitroreductase family protein [Halobacteriales archaeon]|nr:nitroreductase family protein [Halobacteriales archaeon]
MTEFEEVLRTRRSVHDYKDEPLYDETIEDIFEKVALSPSGYNLQPWEFLVLRDDENKQALREVAYDQEHVTDASAAVVVLGNKNPSAHAEPVFDDWLEKGHIPNEDVKDALLENVEGMAQMPEQERRVWTTRSTALACMTLMFAAWDEGVATCPMEGFDPDGVADTFDVPDGYEPVMLVTMGYPASGADDIENERKERRPAEETVHYEEFEPVEETTFGG